MIVLIDNYDSFSYNLYQLIGEFNPNIKVLRNDETTLEDIENLNPEAIIISPGPGRPSDAGISLDIVKYFAGKIPILGICLGHQIICESFGAEITYSNEITHGKTSNIKLSDDKLFKGLNSTIDAGRYHSLTVDETSLPDSLSVIARSDDGEIMAVKHENDLIYGLQFHPESILTEYGSTIILNFLNSFKRDSMISEAILKLAKKENISYKLAKDSMDEIMTGQASDVQMSSYLTALSLKGETIDEITASADAMRNHCIKLLNDVDVLEIVGTGGDGSNSFNISTTSAIVISAAGVPVAKHGNRAASSKSGSADVLESLGVNIEMAPEKALEVLEKTNICFLFAQNYHIAMKYVAPIRKELSIPTIFNILGPLTNPAGASMQVLGVYDKSLVVPLANVLRNLGVKSAMVVYGHDKLDEISISDKTTVCEVKNNELIEYVISPEDFDIELSSKEELVGAGPDENAKITLSILKGEKGAKRNAVLLNSAAGLYVAGKVDSLKSGVKLASEIIDSGKALKQLDLFIKASKK
ncbi:bifunctional anthranilate synthase component II/anthranilate phosphoribosyltransferase [Methanobrevibacter sp. OttesenSCG-928-K11]|nr:bifunctional anthranilate synthase component II/anthranilate phosphoribosyltransferase [Methanobrevibacter sp. OttesenSCG-928-K11]MDL2270604.1 bifunctional anthranilate synthase component II/anthranilate phosphoribosyltransferase [Methanobrevibacter sp. OttesenSCG-928-I08]